MSELNKGGYTIREDDLELLNTQRAITKIVNDKFVQVGAIYLKTNSKNPYEEDWFKRGHRDVDLQDWIDSEEARLFNVGFNLQFGWIDLDIDGPAEFRACVFEAMRYLRIDTRFAFGRLSAGGPSHVLVQLGEEEAPNFEALKKFEPREFRVAAERHHVQIRGFATNTTEKNVAKEAKQVVAPGSVYSHNTKPNDYDISVWWGPDGKPARGIAAVAATTPRKVSFNEIVRSIAFGTFLYVVRSQWLEGSRHSTAQRVGGWLARVVKDSQAMNNHEGISGDVFCPIDTDDIAEALLYFICDAMGDTEKHMRVRVYNDAVEKLDRNPDAKIPGWPAMEALFGAELVMALRTTLMPGSDVSHLMKMAERYIYDETDNQYIDRDRFLTPGKYIHDGAELERRHKGDVVRIGGKPREAFRVFESSEMRKRIGGRNLYPDLNPGGIYRISILEEVLSDDDEDAKALTMFNTWRGWPVSPTAVIDDKLMNACVSKLDQLLKYLTRDDENQARWMKSWIAWVVQHPGKKQQIAPVIVGGQGVGKSFLGNIFIPALIGDLWGAASPKLLEGGFSIEPFVDKMVVFIDEARFHGDGSTEEIRKLIRNVKMGGAEKFQSAKTYNIYSRVMFASNRFDMNIGQNNVQDRALFYMKAYDKDYVELSEIKFRMWAESLKPWFEEFDEMLKRRDVREHFMRYFMEFPCTKNEVESIRYSSSGDADIVASNMSWTRRIAKYIIEDGRIIEDLDISYPFTIPDFNTRVGVVCKELGMQSVQGQRVLAEFRDAGLLSNHAEKGRNYLRFTHKIGSLTDLFGEATMVKMEPRFQFDDDDYGENTTTIDDRSKANWRGLNRRMASKI